MEDSIDAVETGRKRDEAKAEAREVKKRVKAKAKSAKSKNRLDRSGSAISSSSDMADRSVEFSLRRGSNEASNVSVLSSDSGAFDERPGPGSRLLPIKSGEVVIDIDGDGNQSVGSLRSDGSAKSQQSVQSAFSSKIMEASRRGMDRAESANKLSVPAADERRHSMPKKEKKSKKHKHSRQRSQIRGIVEKSAAHVKQGEIEHIGEVQVEEKEEDPIMMLPITTELLTPKHFTLFPKVDSRMSLDDASVDGTVATNKRKDKGYLRETAKSKFEKGLKSFIREKYSLARSKFRASLKTHILLHEDIHHLSISPVQEMLGAVERELGDHERSQLHLLAALEICEKALEKLENDVTEHMLEDELEEGGGGGDGAKKGEEGGAREHVVIFEGMEGLGLPGSTPNKGRSHNDDAAQILRDEHREILFINIGRIKKTIEVVKAQAAMQQKPQMLKEESKIDVSKGETLKGDSSKKPKGGKSEAILMMEALMKQRETQMGFVDEHDEKEFFEEKSGIPRKPNRLSSIDEGGGKERSEDGEGAWRARFGDDVPGVPRQGGAKVRLGLKRMSTRNADRLRVRYYSQSTKGEDLYGAGKYAEAIRCFNDAKFALLIIAGRPENKAHLDHPGEAMYAKLRDEINSALLSERITDCHVEEFSAKAIKEEATDVSHMNYLQPATMVSETKKLLVKQIEQLKQVKEGGAQTQAKEVGDLKELLNEANLSLARMLSKQGSVHANVDNHLMALDVFGDSIAAWEEAANIAELEDRRADSGFCADMQESNDDPLLLETLDMMSSHYKRNPPKLPRSVDSLKNTTHLKALSAALQMASSHHARGVEMAKATGKDLDFLKAALEAAMNHHLEALELVRLTQCLRAASNVRSMISKKSMGGRLTTHGRELTVLMAKSKSSDIVQNLGQFMKRCTWLQAQHQLCVSHACLRLGYRALSSKWLSKAVASMEDLHIPDAKRESEVATYMCSVMRDTCALGKKRRPLKQLSNFPLYELALPVFTEWGEEKPRLLLHTAMATLEKGLHLDALDIFEQAMALKTSPDPHYRDEFLHAMNAQIIIHLKEGNADKAVQVMNNRIDIVSELIGKSSLALAKDLHRLACLHLVLGHHEKSLKILGESLHIGSDYDDFDALGSSKLLATTHDAMNDTENAINEYEFTLGLAKDPIDKARLMNAVANQYNKLGGQSYAIDHLDESLKIQNEASKGEGEDADLLFDTMILYGNVMASKDYFNQAIHWYESALNSNPDKSPVHPNNLRAWYNKGVTLFRSGDIIGAGHAFGTILDEVERNSMIAPGTGFVLNAIGSIYFANKDYAGACEQFMKSLSLKNDYLSPRQRAMTLCNIGIAYHKMRNHEESERNFKEALSGEVDLDSSGGDIKATLATIMCKNACILHKRKQYLRAYNMFRDAAALGNDEASDFVNQCGSYAESSRRNLLKQNHEGPPPPTGKISAQTPQFGAVLFSITDGHDNTKYSDPVYSRKKKILAALGVELVDCDSIVESSEDIKVLCDRALEYLLKETLDSRVAYASEFEGLVVEKLSSTFASMKSLLCQYE